MLPDVLIVGQGLAGTLVAWEIEQAGISFAIADPGRASAATLAAAGIINPIAGRRLVKSWRVDAWLPLARTRYREMEHVLGLELWREMRVRRLFADKCEREIFQARRTSGELAPFAGAADDQGFWIEGAARVALPALLHGARERWRHAGRLYRQQVEPADVASRHGLVIDCRGFAGTQTASFEFVPWEFSKGEILETTAEGLSEDVIVNCRHWAAPIAPGAAWVGATHEPGRSDATITMAARQTLEASARRLIGETVVITGQRAGVRVNLPDKRPVAGRHPRERRIGLINGLGAKGALFAPALAQMWINHLVRGAEFEREVDVARFSRGV